MKFVTFLEKMKEQGRRQEEIARHLIELNIRLEKIVENLVMVNGK